MFLHYVLDQWFDQEVRPHLKGVAFLIRYADDFVIGVAREDDARRIMEVSPTDEQVRLDGSPGEDAAHPVPEPEGSPNSDSRGGDSSSPETFDFLGFTHYWGRSHGQANG